MYSPLTAIIHTKFHCLPQHSLAAPDPQKKGLVKLCRKSLVLQEFAQLQSDRSISNSMMSHWSIKGIMARADYKFIAKTVAKMNSKSIISIELG